MTKRDWKKLVETAANYRRGVLLNNDTLPYVEYLDELISEKSAHLLYILLTENPELIKRLVDDGLSLRERLSKVLDIGIAERKDDVNE